MPSFPLAALTPPAPAYVFTPRWLGGVNLNDAVNIYFDRYEVNSTAFVQTEQLWNRAGDVAAVKVDKRGLVILVYGLWLDGAGRRWEDFVTQMEAQQNVRFALGDGTQYTNVFASDLIGTQVAVLANQSPPLRAFRWSMKLTSLHTGRVPV